MVDVSAERVFEPFLEGTCSCLSRFATARAVSYCLRDIQRCARAFLASGAGMVGEVSFSAWMVQEGSGTEGKGSTSQSRVNSNAIPYRGRGSKRLVGAGEHLLGALAPA